MNELSESCRFFHKAAELGITCAFAESMTAGNLTAELVNYPGSSKVLNGGVTAYSNSVKIKTLGVAPSTLDNFGAVSKETVSGMLTGLSRLIPSDIYAAVSGIAGPDGGTDDKPIGTVQIGFLYKGRQRIDRVIFGGRREEIIRQTVDYVYHEMLSLITG
ncbi:MAG: CinA family protein [Spirochaetales bacterium]|nr:CinA family protein [Spirochaetales bacterium]